MSRRTAIAAPLAGFAVCLAVIASAFVGLSAIVGGAASEQGCSSQSNPLPAAGAPRRLQPLFAAAASKYELGSQGAMILAGLTSVESGFGANMGPSSAGAIGWTQFMPATWRQWGVDANGDGKRDPYNAADAIFSSARYLKASGAPADWHRALFAYNHSDAYVAAVLDRARQLAHGSAARPDATNSSPIIVVGDSLEVGTLPYLRSLAGQEIIGNASTGRASSAGIHVLSRMLGSGRRGTVVFDLGTNDATAAALGRSLRQLARLTVKDRVVLVTLNSPYEEAAKNRLLRTYASEHPAVILVPWHEASRGYALPDGIHGAYDARAQLLAKALELPIASATCGGVSDVTVGPIHRAADGGHLVPIPGQPGMEIDARILPDVLYLIRRYHLRITAGYAATGHAPDGEHPLGLAIDAVPGPHGNWDDVDRLAAWAEPTQNAPRPPFRWVGYNGDSGHGRGNHVHLSWMHAPDTSRQPPAAWVDTFSTREMSA